MLIGIVRAKGIMKYPLITTILRALEMPGVELVYGAIKIIDENIEVELTLSKIIKTLIKWISDNVQTNVGIAVSVKHLAGLLEENISS